MSARSTGPGRHDGQGVNLTLENAWYNRRKMTNRWTRFAACVLALFVCHALRAAAQSSLPGISQTLDLNTALIPQLQTLPGVTLDIANQIVAGRPYDSVEQFRTRSGLPPAVVDKLVPLVTAEKPEAGPARLPKLPPGAVPISPEQFQKGFTRPGPLGGAPHVGPDLIPGVLPSLVPRSVPGGVPGFVPGGAPRLPPGATTNVPVPPDVFQRIPVPKGIVTENIPVPGAPPSPPPRPFRVARAALLNGAAAVAIALAVTVWLRRTSPARLAKRRR